MLQAKIDISSRKVGLNFRHKPQQCGSPIRTLAELSKEKEHSTVAP